MLIQDFIIDAHRRATPDTEVKLFNINKGGKITNVEWKLRGPEQIQTIVDARGTAQHIPDAKDPRDYMWFSIEIDGQKWAFYVDSYVLMDFMYEQSQPIPRMSI